MADTKRSRHNGAQPVAQCPSGIAIRDGAATLEAVCAQPAGHPGPHTSVLFGWPRLDQRTGTPQ
jgi:hypothetical protein